MTSLLSSPWTDAFDELVESAQSSLMVCSPYIGREPCQRVMAALLRRGSAPPVNLFVLTDLSRDNMISGATDVAALTALVEALPNTEVRFLPSLHAKVYVADTRAAVVTSANFTENGLCRNFEYGIFVQEPSSVAKIRADVLDYADLGSSISLPQLKAFGLAADNVRSTQRRGMASFRKKLRAEFDDKLAALEEVILCARAGERSLDAILSDAIMYLLRGRPMTTPEIHDAVQRIHPDLCDDSIDRIINGRSFGKKWKHAVRRAQYHLQQKKKIRLNNGRWMTHD